MLTVETDGTEEAKTKIITVYPSVIAMVEGNGSQQYSIFSRPSKETILFPRELRLRVLLERKKKKKGEKRKKEKKPPLKTRRRSFRGTGRRGTRVDGGRIIAQLHSPPPFPPFGSKTRSPPLPAPVAGEIRKVAWYIKPKGTS